MNNTTKSFADKWRGKGKIFFDSTLTEGSEIRNWIFRRNGWNNLIEFQQFLAGRNRVLDAGCGNGRVTKLIRMNSDPEKVEIIGVDLVSHDIAEKNLEFDKNVSFYSADLMQPLADLGKFDFIYSQEVLHHTEDPQIAFHNLANVLRPGGILAIYVYKKKPPVREFCDDYVRKQIAELSFDEAIEVAQSFSTFGKELQELQLTIRVPDLPVLNIEKGEYDLQQFIYDHFFKCFWNNEMNTTENDLINYDWYHPQNCSRHTQEEVEKWFLENGLTVTHSCTDQYGITMHGAR